MAPALAVQDGRHLFCGREGLFAALAPARLKKVLGHS